MFRWLDQLFSRLRRESSEHHAFERGWVEPSNAITRAILSGSVPPLAITMPREEPALAQAATPAPEPAMQPTPVMETSAEILESPEPARATPGFLTRTAQRARRRRATRAA